MHDQHGAGPIDLSVRTAGEGTALQSRFLGLETRAVAIRRHDSLAGAVRALLERHGAFSADADRKLASLDGLPEPLDRLLGVVVDAFLTFETASASGPATGLGGRSETRLAEIFAARDALIDAAEALDSAAGLGADGFGTQSSPLEFPPWFALGLNESDDTYATDFALLIDLAGSDTYLNNAGGSNLHGGACNLAAIVPSPAAALLDLDGNDHFTSGRSCGANGGGSADGVGFLFDGGGNDLYTAGDFGTNGGGNFGGVGFLLDKSGGDTYQAGGDGTNGGAAALGVGLLIDGGDAIDTYTAGGLGTNGGGQIGAGGLLDLGGADTYTAGSIGTNGGCNGGVAFLIDAAGNDHYTADSVGVNGGASGGVSMLLDGGGFDVYLDDDGGAGNDKTAVPKGAAGAQIDVAG